MPEPRRDDKALADLTRYLAKPRTISDIRDRYGISERSAYRWIDYLQELGVRVFIERKITYVVQP